jgi:sialate O-acetylesterase
MIGAGGRNGPLYSSTSRSYTVPAALATAGRGVIAIRVFAHTRRAGQLCSPGSTTLSANGVTLNLHSWWQSKVESQFARQPEAVEASLPTVPVSSAGSVSTMLFNGMIAPLIPYSMRGVIWYQGEQNSNRAAMYRTLFPTLIRDWRSRWGADLPFYFVQLANFMGPETEPAEADWAELREAQSFAAKTVPGTGMVVTIDIGTGDNIHPPNKQDVGARLALLALNRTYGRPVEDSGPVLESWTVENGTVRLRFSHTTGGLITSDGKAPQQFAIAGDDRVFRWAQASIEGDTVVLRNPSVPNPVAARFGWANNPEGINLRNGAGLPASPFRTDTWPRALPAACLR